MAKAKVIRPLTIELKSGSLDFGTITSIIGQSNIITMSTAGTRTSSLDNTLVSTHIGGIPTFSVTGEKETQYVITLPSGNITLTSEASHTMIVTEFVHNAGVTPTLDTNGKSEFAVGAKLNISADQYPGQYAGTFDVTMKPTRPHRLS